jgi:O-antigen ligase
LLLAAGGLSTLAATDRHEALRGYREWLLEPGVWFGLLCVVEVRLRSWITGACALLATGTAIGILAIVQLIAHQNTGAAVVATIPRVMALYGSPDNLGLLLDRVVPFWFAALLVARWRGRQLAAALAVGAVLVCALGFTFSRGAWVGVAIACIALSLRYRWGRKVAVLCAIIAIGAVAWKGPSVVRALQTGHANTAERRVYVWKSAARLIRDHPILGVGPDNFIHYYAPGNDKYLKGCRPGLGYMDQAAADEPCLSHPHNEFLDFWLSAGIAGLVAFLWLMIAFWRNVFAALNRVDGAARILLLGAAGAMLASLIHGFVDNFYFLADLSVIIWLLCGIASYLGLRNPAGSGGHSANGSDP